MSTFLPLDSATRGAHFLNVTAREQGGKLQFNGVFDAAELMPVLLFSVGMPWVEPCVENVCCLWEVVNRYKDNDLLSALGSSCNENMNFTDRQLMKRSTVTPLGGGGTLKQWDLTTRIHPNFVIMLFLCLTPAFYMYYEVVPVQWIERKSVTWSAAWYGDLCHTVKYPDGREVCIHCSNPKPPHSVYVFSADWFRTFECKWICDPGYTGPNCEVALDTAVYAAGGMFAVMCVSGIILVAMYGRNLGTVRGGREKKVIVHEEQGIEKGEAKVAVIANAPIPTQQINTPRMQRSEVITFKENMISEIRIKLL